VEQVQRVLAERKPGADEAALAARFLARGEGAWEWGGNAGTRAGRDFVGTTDNTPLELRAANQTVLRLLPGVDSPTLAGGFAGNRAAGVNGAVIAGGGGPGQPQVAAGHYAFLGAGLGNSAGLMSAVAGGAGNEATAATGFIGGGFSNRTTEAFAVIGGGAQNTAADRFTFIGGGTANRATGASAVIAGGRENQTTAEYAAIPGGRDNLVRGAYGLAAGRRAKAVHAGSFVWADAEDADAVSERDDHFLVRAAGGVTFRTGGAALAGIELAPGGNAWSVLSTRAAKENFQAVNPERVLEAVSKLPLGTWNLRTQDPSVRHLGPVAEDFHAAFGLGESAERIQTGDADGVALAAIQGLHRQNARQAEEIEELRHELRELREALRK
jgi:trimeric autotransporter adhesin